MFLLYLIPIIALIIVFIIVFITYREPKKGGCGCKNQNEGFSPAPASSFASSASSTLNADDIDFHVITLHNKDRLKNIEEQQKKIGDTRIHLFDGIWGDSINKTELIKNNVLSPDFNGNEDPKIRGREIGCYLSHKYVIDTIQPTPNKYTVIFEDDFTIESTFMNSVLSLLQELVEKGIDFDMLFLGNQHENHGNKILSKQTHSIYGIDKNALLMGTYGYIINNRHCRKIQKCLHPAKRQIDIEFNHRAKDGDLTVLMVYPTIVHVQNKLISTIQSVQEGFSGRTYATFV